uniref:Uncharacterized protein n=1 Tax=Populus trichocarpa TaxID=3694 RepID=A0A3N7FP07_POPTR
MIWPLKLHQHFISAPIVQCFVMLPLYVLRSFDFKVLKNIKLGRSS